MRMAARRIGGAFARFVKAPKRGGGAGHADLVAGPGGRLHQRASTLRASGRSSTSDRFRPMRCTSLRGGWTCPGRCSPPPTTRPATTGSSSAGGRPLRSDADSGLEDIRALAESDEVPTEGAGPERDPRPSRPRSSRTTRDHCRSFVDQSLLRPLKVAIDAGNGMAGSDGAGASSSLFLSRSCLSTSSSTGRSRTTRRTPSSRRTSWTSSGVVLRRGL